MIIIIDSEGTPTQEFSAIYMNADTGEIVDVFHCYVRYPFSRDKDSFSRHHIHGLDRAHLLSHGLHSEEELLTVFQQWLKTHPFDDIFAHAPAKEMKLLSLPVNDIALKPWKERSFCASHQKALDMKLKCIPVCGVRCFAHTKFVGWKSKRAILNDTDVAKLNFFHHCSLYDCVECAFFLMENKNV